MDKVAWMLAAASARYVGLESPFSHQNYTCQRCCSKCMSKCIGCPVVVEMSADDVVAAVLGLTTGPNYKSA